MKILSKKQIITALSIVLIIIGLVVGVYLVQRRQSLKSKASLSPGEFVEAFEIKDGSGNNISCDKSTNPPTCTTSTLDINVRVKDLSKLLP